jgi:hypothetical protein
VENSEEIPNSRTDLLEELYRAEEDRLGARNFQERMIANARVDEAIRLLRINNLEGTKANGTGK